MTPTDEQIDGLLDALDDIARTYDNYEYGLPLGFVLGDMKAYARSEMDARHARSALESAIRSAILGASTQAATGLSAPQGSAAIPGAACEELHPLPPMFDSPTVTLMWQDYGRTADCRMALKLAAEGLAEGAMFNAFRYGLWAALCARDGSPKGGGEDATPKAQQPGDPQGHAPKTDRAGLAPAAPEPLTPNGRIMIVTDEMVSRFLTWRLPDDFGPDCGIHFTPFHPNGVTRYEPVGTNLLTAEQAKAMLTHVLAAAAPQVEPVAWLWIEDPFGANEHHVVFEDPESPKWRPLYAAPAPLALSAERLRRDNENLRTVMIAAAEEIHRHWEAHCDSEGYGPANLMHRLEQGIPSEYGYTAGDFERLRDERDAARGALAAPPPQQAPQAVPLTMEQIKNGCMEAGRLNQWHGFYAGASFAERHHSIGRISGKDESNG
jgi:hypothetical protein